MPKTKVSMDDSDLLQQLYRTVEGRTTARAHTGGIRTAALHALDRLNQYIAQPNAHNLAEFARAERAWAEFTLRPPRMCSEDVQKLVRAAGPGWRPKALNTNNNKGYSPYSGFVYAMWSKQRPRLVKLGVTSRHPSDRHRELQEKHGFEHLEILFFFEVGSPRDIEHELHKRLGTYMKVQNQFDSREWFELGHQYALDSVKRTIIDLKVRTFGTQYICKALRAPQGGQPFAADNSYFGGIRVKQDDRNPRS